MHVGRGDSTVQSDREIGPEELATGVPRRLEEADALAGRCALDDLS